MKKERQSSKFRDAGTGQFVTKQYAVRHPKTTVRETTTVRKRK